MYILFFNVQSWYFASKFGLKILTTYWKFSGLGQVHRVQLKGPFWLMEDQVSEAVDGEKSTITMYPFP